MSMWAEKIEKKAVAAPSKEKFASAITAQLDSVKYAGSKESLFNHEGVLNAYDSKDARAKAEKFATSTRKTIFASAAKDFGDKYKSEQMQLSDLLKDQGRACRFASDQVPLVMQRLDYQGFARQILKPHTVQQGQIIDYDEDINITAQVIAEDGQSIIQAVKGDRMFVPEYTISANPRVTVQEVLVRQYDIVDRLMEKTTMQIQMTEDRNMLRQLYQAGQTINDIIEVAGTLDKGLLEDLQQTIENHRLNADKFIMHRSDYGDLKKAMNAMDFDPVTSRELLMSGIFSSIWGVNILVSAGMDEAGQENMSVPKGVFFAVADGRFVGNFPIRQELTIANADQFVNSKIEYGWLYYEMIGQVITNPRAIAVGFKSGAKIPAFLTR